MHIPPTINQVCISMLGALGGRYMVEKSGCQKLDFKKITFQNTYPKQKLQYKSLQLLIRSIYLCWKLWVAVVWWRKLGAKN